MSWTFRVPFQNVKNFVSTRPPAVIFGISIATFCIVTFGLSLYVKHTSSALKNPDEKVNIEKKCYAPNNLLKLYFRAGMM